MHRESVEILCTFHQQDLDRQVTTPGNTSIKAWKWLRGGSNMRPITAVRALLIWRCWMFPFTGSLPNRCAVRSAAGREKRWKCQVKVPGGGPKRVWPFGSASHFAGSAANRAAPKGGRPRSLRTRLRRLPAKNLSFSPLLNFIMRPGASMPPTTSATPSASGADFDGDNFLSYPRRRRCSRVFYNFQQVVGLLTRETSRRSC